jgi:D-glycero-D-manno-heptose 1,7-bisphosphate phosphatase
MKPAAFLDRDGVIVQDHEYVADMALVEWMPGVAAAVNSLREHGFRVVVVTNQSGVARGYFTEAQCRQFNEELLAELQTMGAEVDALYYCPHDADAHCACRKPRPGMIESAIEELALERDGSFLIGDRGSDLLAAQAARIPGYLFDGADLAQFVKDLLPEIARRSAR